MQSINLYLDEFKPKKEWLDIPQFFMACTTLVLLFVAIGMWQSSKTSLIKNQIVEEELLLEPLRAQTLELAKLMSSRPKDDALDIEIVRIEKDLMHKSQILSVLQNSKVSGAKGFSDVLKALAQPRNNRLWFTGISLNQNTLVLKGQTLEPELISEWVEKNNEVAALNRQFEAVDILRNKNNDRVFDFELSGGVMIANGR